jgi:hypothetical protein
MQPFTVPRTTSAAGVVSGIPYFVKSDFKDSVAARRDALRKTEEAVQDSFYHGTKRKCDSERNGKLRLLMQARSSTGRLKTYLMEQHDSYQMPACDDLEKYFSDS